MGFFSSLFGGGDKTDFGAIYPEPPKLRVDDADKFLAQIDQLIGEYDSVRDGTNMFDAIKFVYEPQKAELDRLYGIGTLPGDTYGAKSGALQQLQAGMNQRGLLDTGTSGLLESQVYADRNRQLADLFGQSKQIQRDDYFDSLTNLERLFPQRFEVRNIPNAVNYMNDMNSYNVATQRNSATEGDRLMRNAQEAQTYANLFGMASGIPVVGSVAGGVGNMFQSTADGYNNRASLFGGGGGGGTSGGGMDIMGLVSSLFGGGGASSINTSSGSGVRQSGPIPINQSGNQIVTSSGLGYRQPAQSAASQSSLVSSNSPGMSNKMDFAKLLMQVFGAGIA